MDKHHKHLRVPVGLLMLVGLMTLAAAPGALAGIGISPVSLTYEDMLRDGYAENSLIVTSSLDNPIPVYGSRHGDIAEWVHFSTAEASGEGFEWDEGGSAEPAAGGATGDAERTFLGTVGAGKPLIIPVVVTPPADAATGKYEGYLVIETGHLGTVSDTMGSAIKLSLLNWVNVGITGEERRSCQIGGITLADTEPGMPLEVSLVVRNSGNVRLSPAVEVDIWDQSEEELLLSENLESQTVLPTTRKEQRFYMDHGLPVGQYWALVGVPECGFTTLLTFDVLPPGGIVDRGVLESVSSEVWALVGEIVPVRAVFTNTGQRSVTATFKGAATADAGEGKVAALLESDAVVAEPGQSVELLAYFTPEEPGQYELSGRVHYNGKITYEKGTLLNVNSMVRRARLSAAMVILYMAVLAAAAVLLFAIKRERRRRRGPWK